MTVNTTVASGRGWSSWPQSVTVLYNRGLWKSESRAGSSNE